MEVNEWNVVTTPSQTSSLLRLRPTPKFFPQSQTFSTKKDRNTIDNRRKSYLPRPPCKNQRLITISRIFPNRNDSSAVARPITFSNSKNSKLSKTYNSHNKDLYFDQCFEVYHRLGVGSFGEVFKVRSREDGKFYAVKISRERFRGKTDKRRKLEEVARHEQLPKHRNCLGFIKAWEEKQRLYIQTELCHTSLFEFAELNHDIPSCLIENYLLDLIQGIKHLHDNGLVHMDIKPDNILITEEGVCKLGDLGLVLALNKEGECSDDHQEGDPRYLAPELLTGDFGKPADVFSLGITILELAGDIDLPRGGDLWHKLREGELPEEFLKGLSPNLHSVLEHMMQPDPLKRPTVDELLALPFIKEIRDRVPDELKFLKMLPLQHTPPTLKIPEIIRTWESSDDDILDEGIELNNNGHNLNLSSSSDEVNIAVVRSHQPPTRHLSIVERKMFTTPRMRSHVSRISTRSYKNSIYGRESPSHHNTAYQRYNTKSDMFAASTSSGSSSNGSLYKDETRVKLFTSSPNNEDTIMASPTKTILDSFSNRHKVIEPKNLMNAFSEEVL